MPAPPPLQWLQELLKANPLKKPPVPDDEHFMPFPDNLRIPPGYIDSKPPVKLEDANKPHHQNRHVEEPAVPAMPLRHKPRIMG